MTAERSSEVERMRAKLKAIEDIVNRYCSDMDRVVFADGYAVPLGNFRAPEAALRAIADALKEKP